MKAIQWAAKQNNDLKYFGLPAIQPTLWEKIQTLCPPSPKWKLPPEDLEPWFLFLDGSAYGQTRRDVTISSWAVVRAHFMEHKFTKISSGFTPSWEHSSFRAEVAAILEALQLRKFCHLFSDCQICSGYGERIFDATAQRWLLSVCKSQWPVVSNLGVACSATAWCSYNHEGRRTLRHSIYYRSSS